jgi:hypothetical protein
MIRKITTVLLLMTLAGTTLFAQAKPGGIARELAMGAARVDRNIVMNPFIVMDPTWLLVNPAYLMKYSDYAWFNIAGGAVSGPNDANIYGNQFGGVNFSFGKELAIGAILSYDASVTNSLWTPLNTYLARSTRAVANPAAAAGAPRAIEIFEVLAAFDMGGFELGAGISYGSSNQDFTNTPPSPSTNTSEGSLSARTLGIRAGVRMDMGGGSVFEGALAARFNSAKDTYTLGGTGTGTGTSEYSAGTTELEVNARLALKMSKRFTLVPYGALRMYSIEPKEDGRLEGQAVTKYSYKNSVLSMSVGIGGEVKVKDFLLAGGLSFAIRNDKTETNPNATTTDKTTTVSSTITAFPVFNLGVEYPVLDWLTVRGGYYRALAILGNKTAVDSGATTERNLSIGNSGVVMAGYVPAGNDENGLMTLGLGLKFGGFALDATVSEQALRRGLGLIGSQDFVNTFGYVTMSYVFE